MNSEKRKRKKRQVRTQQIIDAAIETIKEKSLEKATMDEIAEHAELSKGALYFYFKDKSALLRAIQKESIRTL
ncbi:MAG: helix-turn-helix domain-containing protein, partial [Chloroflexota bacterium]|nr:helix-turn-helix domain-containing protein [Chloroflexota bacterium]